MNLTDRNKEVIGQLFDSWMADGYPLVAKLSYQDVFDLCDKLGIEHPKPLIDTLAYYERKAEKHRRNEVDNN